MSLSSEQFGAIEPERLNADKNFAVLGRWEGTALDLEDARSARFSDHCGFHRGHASVLSFVPTRGTKFITTIFSGPIRIDMPLSVDSVNGFVTPVVDNSRGLDALCARRVGGGEAVALDLPGTVELLE